MIPHSLTFLAENGQLFDWWLADPQTGAPIINATVTATLYANRSRFDPDASPGTPVPNATGLSLTYQGNDTNGARYQVLIGAAFDPAFGGPYVMVIDASAPLYQSQHWEIPAVVVPRST